MTSLADAAAALRVRRFVGRDAELDVLRAALSSEPSARPIVYLHGPGGVGKTALIEAASQLDATSGRRWVWLHASAIPTSLPMIHAAVLPALDPTIRTALVVDGYEQLAHLDGWFRHEFLPALPASTVVFVTSRRPPCPDWSTSPVLAPLTEVLAVRNLDWKEAHELLALLEVDPILHDAAVSATHGHPLALHLVAEEARRTGAIGDDPSRTATILRAVVGDVPDDRHRRALEVCALARVTTEDLLRAALDETDVRDLFEWLRAQCFIRAGVDGVYPHDVARDALDADLSWRDPQRYEALFRAVSGFLIRRLHETQGGNQQRAILDVKFMHRYHPVSRSYADWASFGQSYAQPARDGDVDDLVGIIDHWEGPEAARLARRWHTFQPDGFFVVRHVDGQVRGVAVCVELSGVPDDVIAGDPVARAAVEAVGRGAGPRPGERVTMLRFLADREAYQGPSPTSNVGPALSIQHYLTTPGLAAQVLVLADNGRWDEYLEFFEIRKVRSGPVLVGGLPYALFVRDFRTIPLDEWLHLMLERDLAGVPTPLCTVDDELVALARDEFDSAVRDALRNLAHPDRLAANPLVRSRLVRHAGDGEDLASVLRRGVETIAAERRCEKQARALMTTYLRGPRTQEVAAELLDLPMTTYKRHLRQGVERLTDALWEREVGG